MSSIHYKLKSTLEYKTLTFDGLHISVDDLKKMICDKENIRTESFDLILTNTHTKRQYNSEDLSSQLVRDCAKNTRENALKLPKVQDTSTSGIVNRNAGVQSKESTHISSEDYAKMSEEEKLDHVKQQSTQKYHSDNFNKKTSGILTGPPPPTYVCNRCSQPGHWFKACPLLNTKRTTGIPMEELMETTPDDPQAMLHPSGKYVVQIRHYLARLNKKTETVGGGGGTPKETEDVKEIPPELSCRLCKNLLKEAMLAVCVEIALC
uniref:E3 ubiquitin-protein ligase RBBP6 n=1 Tax=Ditylenchus dipsaci TaxID=166011 RepID=A0A915ENC8_9BILA